MSVFAETEGFQVFYILCLKQCDIMQRNCHTLNSDYSLTNGSPATI